MKYFDTYTNEGPSQYVKCEKSYPHVAGKIAVLSRIRSFCRSNKIELLYENAKNNPKGRSLCAKLSHICINYAVRMQMLLNNVSSYICKRNHVQLVKYG